MMASLGVSKPIETSGEDDVFEKNDMSLGAKACTVLTKMIVVPGEN